MISIDFTTTGAGVVTPPAVGVRCSGSVGQGVLMAPHAAPQNGTGLPSGGTTTPIRLRGLIAAAGSSGTTTGAFLGATVRPSVQNTELSGFVVAGAPVQHTSSTPGDLPPEDPLS